MKTSRTAAWALPLVLAATTAFAQPPVTPATPGAATAVATTPPWTQAEVRKIDPATGKITLKHEDIKNLDMPAMTMVFRAKDTGALTPLKAGDRVRFVADKIGGEYTVTLIEKVVP